jgi:hypothetical protein
MRLLYWTLNKTLNAARRVGKGFVIVFAIVMVTLLVHETNTILDVIDNTGETFENYQSIENLPPYVKSDILTVSPNAQKPLLALYRKEKNGKLHFHCTAFVISNKLAVTAAHCVYGEGYDLTKDDIMIYNGELQDTKVIAKAGALNIRADLAVLVGDFSGFDKLQLNYISGFIGLHGPFMVCGFPWGNTPAICNPFAPMAAYYDKVRGGGLMSPGMSGGPVIDDSNGVVAGVNVEVGNGYIAVAPVTGIFGALEIKVQE